MIQATPARAFQDKDSANAVLALLNSEDFIPDRQAQHYPSSTAIAITTPRACARIDDAGTDAKAAPLASAPLPRPRSDAAIEDWDDLFNAVAARLRLTVVGPRVTPAASQPADEADRIRVAVLECVAALEQLHATLKDELGQRPQP